MFQFPCSSASLLCTKHMSLCPDSASLQDEEALRSFFYRKFKTYYTRFRDDDDHDGFSADDNDKTSLEELLSAFHRIAYSIEKSGVFSVNEELDDVNTADLLFILVPFILAELHSHGHITENRLQHLESAILYWKQFLATCEALQLCQPEQAKIWHRDAPPSAACRRQEKIQCYRHKKELNEKIQSLVERKRKVVDPFAWGTSYLDEELERELSISLIKRSIDETLEHQEAAALELELLRSSASQQSGAPPICGNGKVEKKPFIFKIDNPLQLRESYRNTVFKPYHELPTITLDEVAAWEMDVEVNQIGAAGREKEKKRQARLAAEQEGLDRLSSDETDSDSESQIRAKEEKARSWDDWKDDNPKGWGNKNRNVG